MDGVLLKAARTEQLDALKPLLQASWHRRYRFLEGEMGQGLNALWLQEITGLAGQEQSQVLVAWRSGEPVGLVACSDLPWDTRVIGRPMGALKHLVVAPGQPDGAHLYAHLLEQAESWATSRGLEFLLCKVYTDDVATIHALERRGFLLADALLDHVYDLRRDPLSDLSPTPLPAGFSIRPAGPDDEEELAAVAGAAFRGHFGRYHTDERISQEQATRVYEEWMRASCHGYADWVLVAEVGGRIAGCSVWKKPSPAERSLPTRVGHYNIGLIHPEFHGRGLFTALTRTGMELFAGVADCIEGPTHVNNYPVQRGFARLRWRIYDARLSFHKWLTE